MPRKKDKIIHGEDGWSTVKSGLSSNTSVASGSDPYLDITYEKLLEDYAKFKADLHESASWAVLVPMLKCEVLPVMAKGITKVVCLGLGSTMTLRTHRSSLYQLALLDLLVELLGWGHCGFFYPPELGVSSLY